MFHSLHYIEHLIGAACLGFACGVATLAGQAPRYTIGWQDAAVVGGALITAVAALRVTPAAVTCAPAPPCDPATLPGIDRWAVSHDSRGARVGSDIALASVGAGALFASLARVGPARARGDAVVFVEAVSWTGAVTEWLKVEVHRARPDVYRTGGAEAANSAENRESFPSGHTSAAFAAATAYATLAARQHLPHARRNSLLLFAGASLVGALRVAGGKHFPTDVLAGAALDSAVGWSVATLHPMTH